MQPTSSNSMRTRRRRKLGRRKLQILQTLNEQPLLSRRQIELACQMTARRTQKHLASLQYHGYVTAYNTHQPWLYARALYALTQTGNEIVMAQGQASASVSVTRLAHLLVRMERVFKTRNLFLWLTNAAARVWQIVRWDVEIECEFHVRDKSIRIPFHGAAHIKRQNGRWSMVFVEFDTGRVPIANLGERMRALVEAQNDPRFAYSRTEDFPTHIIIAADSLRLQAYYSHLRTHSIARHSSLPSAYLAVASEAIKMRDDPTAPIWYSSSLGRRTTLLFDASGNTTTCPTSPTWQLLAQTNAYHANYDVKIEPLGSKEKVKTRLIHLASLSLALEPLDKQLLDEVARHPLLTADELALVLQSTLWYVETRLRQLVHWKLIEAYTFTDSKCLNQMADQNESPESGSSNQVAHYLIGKPGIRYLAVVAGFDNRVSVYAQARGWGKGLDVLLKHYEHTQQENAVFLQLAQIAQRRKHTLTWLSELESRLYYDINDRRHSFLPDGRGTYIADEHRYEFTVEIDRSRMSRKKLRRKMNEYIACLMSNVLRGELVERLHILFVTQSWERAETVRKTVLALAREKQAEQVLDLYITTFDRLQASGADAAIWIRIQAEQARCFGTTFPKTYCFDCFKPTREAQSPTIISDSLEHDRTPEKGHF